MKNIAENQDICDGKCPYVDFDCDLKDCGLKDCLLWLFNETELSVSIGHGIKLNTDKQQRGERIGILEILLNTKIARESQEKLKTLAEEEDIKK